jgi:hypothetical protein
VGVPLLAVTHELRQPQRHENFHAITLDQQGDGLSRSDGGRPRLGNGCDHLAVNGKQPVTRLHKATGWDRQERDPPTSTPNPQNPGFSPIHINEIK